MGSVPGMLPLLAALLAAAAPVALKSPEAATGAPGPNANTLRGVLRDEAGRAVSGQKLSVVWSRHGGQSLVTDAQGRFLASTAGSSVEVRVEREGFERINQRLDIDPSDGTDVELTLR